MKSFFRFYFALFFVQSLDAQNLDSLKALLETKLHDTTRINILIELTENENDEKKWMPYNKEIYRLSSENLKKTGSKSSLYFFYQKNLAAALNNFGFSLEEKGESDSAIFYYEKSLNLQKQIKEDKGLSASLINIGHVYENKGNVVKALSFYFEALKIQEEKKDTSMIPFTLMNIGSLYRNQGNNKKAFEFLTRSLKINEELNNKNGIASALINLGNLHSNMYNFPEAIDCFKRSLKIREEIGDKHGIAYCLGNLGTISHFSNDNKSALLYYQKGLEMSKEIGDMPGVSWALLNIAEEMLTLGKNNDALSYGRQSLELAKEIGYAEHIRNSSELLTRIYKKLNRKGEALDMFELYIQMRDSISNAEIKKSAIEKQLQYQYEKKLTADSIRSEEKTKVVRAELAASAAKLKQEATLRYALFAGLGLILICSIFIFNRFKVTQKQKKIIEKQKALVDLKQKEVIDSIYYASRIQKALLPNEKYLERTLKNSNTLTTDLSALQKDPPGKTK